MKDTLKWLNEAVDAKGITLGMNHYCVVGGEIKATDGRITAGHPWPFGPDEFLVPGEEFSKLVDRMPGEPKVKLREDGAVVVSSGRFRGTIVTLPIEQWDHPGVEPSEWRPLPQGLVPMLKILRPFVSDNATQQWAMSVALENGWAYATNNIAIAGGRLLDLEDVHVLLPVWAIDFILGRSGDLVAWTWNEHFFGFRWRNGAWMRAQCIASEDGKPPRFPEKAAALIRESREQQPTQVITKEFREVFERIADLADDTVAIYADRVEARFGKAVVEDGLTCEVPEGGAYSLWGAAFLLPALKSATAWSPGLWPKPSPWKGPILSGYVVGRRA